MTAKAHTGPRPRKNPSGLLRSVREWAGVSPGDGAKALGMTRDAMSRREAAPLGSVRIEDAAAHLRAFSPQGRIVVHAGRAQAVDRNGHVIGNAESVDGELGRVQFGDSAESHGVRANRNCPSRAHEKGPT